MEKSVYRDASSIFQSVLYTIIGLLLLHLAPIMSITNLELQITISMFLIGAIMYISYHERTVVIKGNKLVITNILSSQDIKFDEISKVVLSKKISTARLGYNQDIHLFGNENNKKLGTISSDLIGRKELMNFINIIIKNSGATLVEEKENFLEL